MAVGPALEGVAWDAIGHRRGTSGTDLKLSRSVAAFLHSRCRNGPAKCRFRALADLDIAYAKSGVLG